MNEKIELEIKNKSEELDLIRNNIKKLKEDYDNEKSEKDRVESRIKLLKNDCLIIKVKIFIYFRMKIKLIQEKSNYLNYI